MACNFNIKVVEQNDFTICIPLKKRTFVASTPIDEDVDILALEDLSVKIGGAVFPATRDAAGVMVDVSRDALARGTYDVVLTATYKGHAIKAAYFDSLTIVEWNYQSDAQQCVQGSPIMFEAGFVIYNLTDSELEALKAQLRLEIAAAQQAKEEAEQAKEEYIAKAEALDDIAQQSTLTQGVQDIREDISHIDIDTSNLAKQGSNTDANISDIQAKIDALGADQLKVQECYNIAEEKYATMPEYRTIENLPATIETINATRLSEIPVSALTIYSAQTIVDYKGILFYGFPNNTGAIEVYNLKGSGGLADKGVASVTKIQFADWTGNPSYFRCNNLNWVDATGFHMPANGNLGSFTNNPNLIRTLIGDHTLAEVLDGLAVFDGTATSQAFWQNATSLRREDFRAMINGLADLTGQTAQTLTIGYGNLQKLTADDIAVATAKNWTLA